MTCRKLLNFSKPQFLYWEMDVLKLALPTHCQKYEIIGKIKEISILYNSSFDYNWGKLEEKGKT